MSEIILYGIPNCDSIKKTINWFKLNQIDFTFHDYKKSGIEKKQLQAWCKAVGWEMLLNKKGTTWKKIAAEYDGINITTKIAVDIMHQHQSTIKRPVIEKAGQPLIVGFDEQVLSKYFL